MLKTDYKRVYGTFSPDATKHVSAVDIVIMMEDVIIRNQANEDVPMYVTDLQFQPGNTLTGWVPKTDEMLSRLPIVLDESIFVATPNIMLGAQPQVYDLDKRTFNIVGRGHQTITIPNYYPEDWFTEILPTGIDITIFAKDDFDLCRISTAVGALLPEGEGPYTSLPDHPLNYKYTREFWIEGASAGSEIKLNASTMLATLNGVDIPIWSQKTIDVAGKIFNIGHRRFILAPTGSVRFRIELYKNEEILEDTGIGFYGTAEIVQWTYGYSRI